METGALRINIIYHDFKIYEILQNFTKFNKENGRLRFLLIKESHFLPPADFFSSPASSFLIQ